MNCINCGEKLFDGNLVEGTITITCQKCKTINSFSIFVEIEKKCCPNEISCDDFISVIFG